MKLIVFFISFFIFLSSYGCENDKLKDCDNSLSEVIYDFSDYIAQRQRFLNKPVKVKGRFFGPAVCSACPPEVSCKPCFNQYFDLESLDKKLRVSINIKFESKILMRFKDNQEVTLLIKYLENQGSGVSSEFGFFELESDN